MKRSRIVAGLAILACLAVGSASLVFGQLGSPGQTPQAPMSELEQPGSFPIQNAQTAPTTAKPVLPSAPVIAVPPSVFGSGKAPAASSAVQVEFVPESSEGLPDETLEGPEAARNADNANGHSEPAVSLEWAGPATVRLKQLTPYQIIAKNTSNSPLQSVIVRYRVPEGVKVGVSDPPARKERNVLAWDLGTLTPAQEKRIDLEILPETKAAITCQATVTFTASSSIKVHVCEPKLGIKAAALDHVVQGDVVTVAVTVSNAGDGSADHVKLKALLPEGLEHARGKTFELDLGNLSPGENRTVQLVCLARTAGIQAVDCFATADAGLFAKDAAKIDVVLPQLALEVDGPKLRYLERHATYVLKVTNPGSGPASNVSIVYQLPQGFKFDKASNGGRHDFGSRTVSWFIGDLGAAETREVSLDLIANTIGEHHHRAVATAARGLKTECEMLTRVEGLSALLMELVDSDDPIEVGAETTYEIRVTNTGSKTETNLELVCTVPEKMELRGAKCASGCRYRVEGKDVIFEPLPNLAPRAEALYRVAVRGVAPGDMRFRARIKADGLSEPVLREESTKVYGD
jgi:uncharacterized repeat protein (TIGR01451 family)